MTIETLTSFFLWCTIINVGLLLFWTAVILFARDIAYRSQSRFFPMTRSQFDLVMYGFLGVFKLLVIVFNLVPWVVLSMVG